MPICARADTVLDSPEQRQQRGDDVHALIQHRSRPLLVEEVRVGMVGVGTVPGHRAEGGHQPADGALLDQLPAVLVPPGQERVRSAADAQSLLPGAAQHRLRLLQGDPERLLRIDVLAAVQCRQVELGVGRRDRQIEHQVGVVAAHQLVHAAGAAEAVFRCHVPRPLRHQIGARGQRHVVEPLQRLQVGVAHHPAADHPEAYLVCVHRGGM